MEVSVLAAVQRLLTPISPEDEVCRFAQPICNCAKGMVIGINQLEMWPNDEPISR